MHDPAGSRRDATARGWAAILLWSTTVALVRSVSAELGALTGAACVYGVAGVAAIARLGWRREQRALIRELPWRYLFGCGALFLGYGLTIFAALGMATTRQQVLEIGLLNYLWPALTLLFTVVLLGKRPRVLLLPGTVLALAGVFLVLTQGDHVSWRSFTANLMRNPLSYTLGVAAALCWAGFSVLTRKWVGGRGGGAVEVFLPVAAVIFALLCPLADEPRLWSARAVGEVVFLGLATYFSFDFWDAAMRRGNVVLVAASSYLTPLLSTVVSCLYLAVVPTPRLWLGCGILIAGSLLSWLSVAE